jgi:hypothetical protein
MPTQLVKCFEIVYFDKLEVQEANAFILSFNINLLRRHDVTKLIECIKNWCSAPLACVRRSLVDYVTPTQGIRSRDPLTT